MDLRFQLLSSVHASHQYSDPPRLAASAQSHALPRLGDLGEGGRVRVMNVPKIGKLIVNVLVAGGRSAPAQRHSGTSDIIVNTDPHHKHLHLDVSIRTLHTY